MNSGVPTALQARLDIVIVNYETPDQLGECLRSVADHGSAAVRDVVVVDNSATPDGAELAVKEHPTVRLLHCESNLGYGSAANCGVASGDGAFALVLNADTRLHAGAVEALIEELDRHPDTGVVGPQLVDLHGRPQPSCANFPTPGRMMLHETGLWKLARRTKRGDTAQPFFQPSTSGVVPWVLGAAIAVRRSDFDAVSGFDPMYFMYYEEVDLCRRLAANGMLTRFTPAATIGHIGGASTDMNPAPMQRAMFRSLALYIRRHGRDAGLVRLRLAVIAVVSARLARDLVTRDGDGTRKEWKRPAAAWRAIVGDAVRGWR